MNLEMAILLAVPVTYFGLMLLERVFPARPLPRIAGWRGKGLLFFLLVNVLAITAPLLWMDTVSRWRLMDLERAGIIGGAVIAFAGTQFFVYWWHRLMHRTDLLWRWFHQMHHSAERHDVAGSMYLHPLDVIGFAFVQSVVPYLVFGVRPEAALIAGYVGTFYTIFQHTNVRTPRWLGYLIQRPESHSVHHGRGIHAFNYADLPLWDVLFGTFRNPPAFQEATGFWDGASSKVGKLLLGRDVASEQTRP